jgi:hypothetical protein
MAASNAASSALVPGDRLQAAEQYFTLSHVLTHFFRHVICRPQAGQTFGGG